MQYRPRDGAKFGKPKNLSKNQGHSSESDLLITGDIVRLIWEDDAIDTEGKIDPRCPDANDIYYRSSHNGASEDVSLSIELGVGRVHVVWTEDD